MRPDFIFATKPDSHSERPLETITPLGVALGLVPDASHDDDHYADVANVIKTEPQFAEKVVLICWHHGNLQALAQAIGAQGAQPWLGTVFDQVWGIDYSSDPGQLKVGYQSLLYGDTAS